MEVFFLVTFKIANQEGDIRNYSINGDNGFYINRKFISKCCSINYYQCSLTIEIIKIFE